MNSLTGGADKDLFKRRVEAKASVFQIGQAVAAMAGKTGLMIFDEIPQGPLLSLVGRKKKATLFLIGNPLIANEIFEQDPPVGLYVPLRLFVLSDYHDRTYIEYDKPSSLLAQFGDERILAGGKMLDQ